ncbi:O-antigen ligase family protein [Oricola sp.]|uniref:O-antigen ligase family protein n=1 Tax=Oricola sp. TaxID=1979950 RepID=UPI003BAA998F
MTVVLWCAFVWAIVTPIIRRTVIARDGPLVAAAIACGCYAAVKIVATLYHNGFGAAPLLLSTLVFLSPLLVGSRLRYTSPRVVLDGFVLACGFAALLALPLAVYQGALTGLRATAFCGNAGVFATMSVIFGSIGALNAASPRTARRWLGMASYLAMVGCVIASGMRTLWIVLPIATVLVGWAITRALPKRVYVAGFAASIALVLSGLLIASVPVAERVQAFYLDIVLVSDSGSYDSSTGRRLLMWQSGWKAVLDAPLTGYGLAGRMDALGAHVDADMRHLVDYTHPHNGYLAALLDAGIAGLLALLAVLAAPVAIALRAPRDDAWRIRVAIAGVLSAAYAVSGAPGIIFEHDLLNSAFVVTLTVLAAAIPVAEKAGEPSRLGET